MVATIQGGLRKYPIDLPKPPADLRNIPADLSDIPGDLRNYPAGLGTFAGQPRELPGDLFWFPAGLGTDAVDAGKYPARVRIASAKVRQIGGLLFALRRMIFSAGRLGGTGDGLCATGGVAGAQTRTAAAVQVRTRSPSGSE